MAIIWEFLEIPMSNAESILVAVRRQLGASKGKWASVAEQSGVPYHTLTKIAQGKVDPRLSTVQRLVDHFAISSAVTGVSASKEAVHG